MSPKDAAYQQAERPGYSLPYAADPSGFGYTQPSDGEPIVTQPVGGGAPGGPGGFMSESQGSHNIPNTLRSLTMVDELHVHREVNFSEGFVCQGQNRYRIKYSTGEELYNAVEESECLDRCCNGPLRSFEVKILDNSMNEVIRLNRPVPCSFCWCFRNLVLKMEVSSPPGTVIGSIEQELSCFAPKINIINAAGDTVLKIEVLISEGSGRVEVIYEVLSRDGGTQVGKFVREWTDSGQVLSRGASPFRITFPMDLDVKMKALIIGACLLFVVMLS